ncbi:MAG: AhpD family alkylhydroperoxidase [Verrucomicrobiales bacterium]|jgi:AhpD family alkylhydroperoxidase
MGFSNFMLSQIGKSQPKLVRYLNAVDHKNETELQAQMIREFGFIPAPVLLHSPSRDLYAGMWILLRETLVVGEVPRQIKEALSLVVSNQNQCPFCIDSHEMALHSLRQPGIADAIARGVPEEIEDEPVAQAVGWATGKESGFAPDPADLPEMLAIVVGFHYLNRIVNVFLEESPLPTPKRAPFLKKMMRWFGARMIRQFFAVKFEPGASLQFLPEAELSSELSWASASPNVAAALARFDQAIGREADQSVSPQVQQLLKDALPEWDDQKPGMGRDWLDSAVEGHGLDEKENALARLGLLSMLASYQVCDDDIAKARTSGATDRELVATVAWACFTIAKRIGNRLAPGQSAA